MTSKGILILTVLLLDYTDPTPPIPIPELAVAYTLFYTINQFRLPLPSEFTAVTALTQDHLNDILVAAFADDDLITYTSSSTILVNTDFNFNEPVGITYNTTLTFTQDSFVPRESEVETLVGQAFSGGNLNTYLADLQGLPASNLFQTTSAITLETGVDTRSGTVGGASSSESILTRDYLILGAGVGVVAAMLAVAGLVFGGRRREKQQVRQKTLMSDGHCTVGEETYDSASRGMDTIELDDVNLD